MSAGAVETASREEAAEPQRPATRSAVATSPLRLAAYAAVLTAMAFSQGGGRMVADTKFDLLTRPWVFLERGLGLWDPVAAFGSLQNQAYGYAWPMGPFFGVGQLLALPPWVVQRLWWALLLCLGFFGVLRLAQRLGVGTPLTQVAAAFAFVLTPRVTTLLGATSVEIWPMALAPWVLLPLVGASERGSVRRGAAMSALVVACAGGVNAVAVAAVLPLGVIWIVTRERGPRRGRLLLWWTALTVAATAWWAGPLLLLGRYSPPFLDYIENATITSVPTDLARTLFGISDWVAYFAGSDFPAGREIVSTGFVLVDIMAITAIGLVGLCLPGLRQQRFLVLGLLVGVTLVGLGYAADLAGFVASDRQDLLDGALAPLRNLHKFDVVLRIPLVLGLAHALSRLGELRRLGSPLPFRVMQAAVALAMVGLLVPWMNGRIPPNGAVAEVPDHWREVATYLADQPGRTVALELPASTFGVYTWGNTHDDVLQGLADSPWAVRNVIPLTQPGAVVMMDRITRMIESGRPPDQLADFLATNGIGHLVVRNDLDRLRTGTPDPAYLRAVLSGAPGITRVRGFGDDVGDPAWEYAPNGRTRLVTGDGLSARLPAVDVYEVRGAAEAMLSQRPAALVGGPGSGLDAAMEDVGQGPRPLLADLNEVTEDYVSGQVVTDGARRREMNFSTVRWNESATMGPDAPYRLVGPEHAHRLFDDEERWRTTETWSGGVSRVLASTSEGFADAVPPLQIDSYPGAAVDGDESTAWASARHLEPTGQWWELHFEDPRPVTTVKVGLAATSAPVEQLRLFAGDQARFVEAPAPGGARTYEVDLPEGLFLRVTAAGEELGLPGSFELSEVSVDGIEPRRLLTVPAPSPNLPVDAVALSRDPDRHPCVVVAGALACSPALAASGEEGDLLARIFRVTTQDAFDLTATVSLRRGVSAGRGLQRLMGASISATGQRRGDVATHPVAMIDGDLATSWVSRVDTPTIVLRLPEQQRVRTIRLVTNKGAAASRPTRLIVRSGERRAEVSLDEDGVGRLPGWSTRRLILTVTRVERAFSVRDQQFVEAPAGISELTVNGARPVASPGEVTAPCGAGPVIRVGGRTLRTSVTADPSRLLRGESVAARICDTAPLALGVFPLQLVAEPTDAFRVDSTTLTRRAADAAEPQAQPLEVTSDDSGAPAEIEVTRRSEVGLLALPQNFNEGWEARLDGELLDPQRVRGWQQGWWVPEGAAGTVELSYAPAGTFRALLAGGAGLVLVVVLLALPLRPRFGRGPRPPLPRLTPAPVGLLDAAVAVGAGGLLMGWWGVAAMLAAMAAGLWLPARAGYGAIAGTALAIATLGLTWEEVEQQDWAVNWTQAWSMLAVAAVVAALAAARRVSQRRTSGGQRLP